MVLGLRVVRGPDWENGDEDGGQDHVGTVTKRRDDNTVVVQWDMGLSNVCRVGKDGKHDVMVFDNAPIGLSHPNVGCVVCEEVCITGTRWKCNVCENVSLCTICYFDDGHLTAHEFLRIDYPGCEPVKLTKRSVSQRARALGIYPTAEVTRGPDWEYGNQDGGNGKVGTVEDVVNYGRDSAGRNSVRVKWPNGNTDIYRLGYMGKVDLKCCEEAPGADFYIDHMARINIPLAREMTDIAVADILKVGDKVCVDVSPSELRQLQQGRREWNTRMEEIIGEIGVLQRVTIEGDLDVQFDGECITLVKGAVKKVPTHQKGSIVRTIKSKEKMQRLQRRHGGWDDSMAEILGKVGKVTAVDGDGDVGVTFGEIGFVFHPSCLMASPGEKVIGLPNDLEEEEQEEETDDDDADDDDDPELKEKEDDDDDDDDDNDDDEDVEDVNVMQIMAGLLLLGALSSRENEISGDEKQTFMRAVIEGREAPVRLMLKETPNLLNIRHNGLPCLAIAAHQGRTGVIGALLDNGANINVTDDKGNTSIIVAVAAENGDAARLLISRGADVNLSNMQKRSPIHIAAEKNMAGILKLLLEKGGNPNIQDVIGDTPLHDAVAERHDNTADILIDHIDLDVWLKNNKLFTTLCFACLKGHAHAVDKLLSKNHGLINCQAANGFYPIHIATINNHVNEASILLVKGKADVNARNETQLTPLHLATTEGYFDMTKLLLTYDADWKLKDSNGNTPLHSCLMGRRTGSDALIMQMFGLRNLAEDNERIKIANFLIQHGASTEERNNLGLTPITGCGSDLMRDAVKTYAENNKATKPEKKETRPRTAKVEKEIFTASTQKCHKCSENIADVRFLPCKHQVACPKCCYKFKHCPICQKEISQRMNKHNKPITPADACVVS